MHLQAKWGACASDKVQLRKGEMSMGGWRFKLVFLLVVYFAGFATAIYYLAPVADNRDQPYETDFTSSTVESDEFAQSFNAGMHSCIGYAKNAAQHAARFIKQKIEEKQNTDS